MWSPRPPAATRTSCRSAASERGARPTAARRIELAAGEAGAAAIAERADQMFRDRWKRLGPAQQRYLATAAVRTRAAPRQAVPTGEIAAALGKHPTQLSRVRASLITEHHLLRAADYGHVEFTFPGFAVWLQDQLAASGDAADASEAVSLANIAQARPASQVAEAVT